MNLDAIEFLSVAKDWLDRNRSANRFDRRRIADPSNLIQISRDVHRLARQETPSAVHLRAAGILFDRLATSRWDNGFGERLEMCTLLAYVGWRHSFLLGLDVESQSWLRIADQLVAENFTAIEPMRGFLQLEESSASLDDSYLGAPIDVFLALSVLRVEMRKNLWITMRSAGRVFRSLSERTDKTKPDPASTFFLGEAAFVSATAARSLGLHSETQEWVHATESLFARLPSNRPLRAKLLALRFVASYEWRRRHSFRSRAEKLTRELARLEMQHEVLLVRLAYACCIKVRGDNVGAQAEYEALCCYCAGTSERAVLALSLANLAEIAAENEPDRAHELISQTFREMEALEDPVSVGSALMAIGAAHLALGESENAIRMFQASIASLRWVGSASWTAYGEILLAEALMMAERYAEARASISRALPIIRSEGMVDEGIHAAKLLSQLDAARFESQRGQRLQARRRPSS